MKKQTKIQVGGTLFGAALGAGVITYLLLQPSAVPGWNVTRGVMVALTILIFAGMGWGIAWCSRPSPWVRVTMEVYTTDVEVGDVIASPEHHGKVTVRRDVPRGSA